MLCVRQDIVPLVLTPGTLERHRCFKVRFLVWFEMHEGVKSII